MQRLMPTNHRVIDKLSLDSGVLLACRPSSLVAHHRHTALKGLYPTESGGTTKLTA